MKAEIKQKWLDDLRSGHIKQTVKNELFDRDKAGNISCLCAMGVLCNIIDPNGFSSEFQTWRKEVCLKDEELINIGLDREIQNTVMHMNDAQKLPFDVIADYIQEAVQVTT